MNKLLIGAAVVALGFGLAAPANAQVKLDLGGHFKGYGAWVDQDTRGSQRQILAAEFAGLGGGQPALIDGEERSLDILRETEIHFTGETTLDNGLTVGFHAEADIDAPGADNFQTEEAYAYFSGAWGRVNFGKEDGAAYLLQVAAPSADSNIDGIRQYVSPVNYNIVGHPGNAYLLGEPGTNLVVGVAGLDDVSLQDLLGNGGVNTGVGTASFRTNSLLRDANGDFIAGAGDIRVGAAAAGVLAANRRFDYDHAVSGTSDKFTYLTPVFNGFQAGFSWAPEINTTRDLQNGTESDLNAYGDVFDVAARYEGQFGELGLAIGAGYSHAELEAKALNAANQPIPLFYRDANANPVDGYTVGVDTIVATRDDRETWNVGVDLNWGPFGLGAAYMEDDNGASGDALEAETWVVGIDYTTGPFKLGASYYNQDQAFGPAELETDRWTGGVTYTYGPGMTFRGSVSYIDLDSDAGYTSQDAEATSILLGTQIDF